MLHKDNKKVADRLAELFANGRIEEIDWRYWIPEMLNNEVKIVRVNALHFAEGLQKSLSDNTLEYNAINLDRYDE